MKFAIIIEGDPHRDDSFERAYRFARAAIAAGHGILRVFCYHDAVRIAAPAPRRTSNTPDAPRDFTTQWLRLAATQGFEVAACVSATERRAIPTARGDVPEGIVIVGLGQYADCLLRADRTITFRP